MANVNIYLPDTLAERVRSAGLNVSAIARAALAQALRVRDALEDVAAGTPGDVFLAANAFRQAREGVPFDVWEWSAMTDDDLERARQLLKAFGREG